MAGLNVSVYRARHVLATAVTWCSGGTRTTAPVRRTAYPGVAAGPSDLDLPLARATGTAPPRPAEVAAASAQPRAGKDVRRTAARRHTASASVRG